MHLVDGVGPCWRNTRIINYGQVIVTNKAVTVYKYVLLPVFVLVLFTTRMEGRNYSKSAFPSYYTQLVRKNVGEQKDKFPHGSSQCASQIGPVVLN